MSPWGPSCLLSLLLCPCLWAPALSYANGKVSKACSSMEPHHHSQGQTSLSPYHLQANSSTFRPGELIQVTLWGMFFEGFLLQARDPAQDVPTAVGSFILTDPRSTQLLNCNNVTVVFHYDTFWVKIPGPIISQHGVTPRPQSRRPPYSEGCGLSKTCLQDPPGCDPSQDPLCFFLSATAHGPPQKQSVAFELSATSDGYVALALSRDTWMGDDDLYQCVSADGRVSVEAAILTGRTHPEEQTQSGLHSVSWRMADGVIQCRFSRAVKPTNQESERFDLNQAYFLFVASGPAHRGQIGKHSQQPLVSEHRVLLTANPIMLRGSRGPTLLKAHGALMLLAWMLTGSVGTFIANFYKEEWAAHSLLGQKLWFQVHRGLMVVTVLLTAVGFCMPFAYRRGWSKHAGVHPYLGCCVLALSLLQPIAACLRPPPDSHRRFIFNWLHWGVGSLTEAMAVAAMFLGVGQSSFPLPSSLAIHILIGYVSWLLAFRLLLFIHKYFYLTKFKADDQRAILPDQSEGRVKVGLRSTVGTICELFGISRISALIGH
uniref:Ferric-chelate reductase 1a n=1 Tax=Neogobius melanostomus TaxID=47308 RepID=A0A8C6UXG8_9GOBI